MPDDMNELHRRLEQATARRCPDADALEPETAALRAGWLAFGELLEAAQPPADPALPRPVVRPAIRQRRWARLAIAALAASVLVAVTLAWRVWVTQPASVPSPTPSQQPSEIAGSGLTPASPTVQPASTPTTEQTPAASGSSETAWDDSLDQKIEQVGRAMYQVERDQLASAATSGRVQYQLDNLKKDIEDNPL